MVSAMKSPSTTSCATANGGSVCFGASAGQRRELQERLRHPDEDVEVERDGGTDHVDPAPRAGEMKPIAGDDRHGQDHQGDDAHLV
jgi:hypothetical protein